MTSKEYTPDRLIKVGDLSKIRNSVEWIDWCLCFALMYVERTGEAWGINHFNNKQTRDDLINDGCRLWFNKEGGGGYMKLEEDDRILFAAFSLGHDTEFIWNDLSELNEWWQDYKDRYKDESGRFHRTTIEVVK